MFRITLDVITSVILEYSLCLHRCSQSNYGLSSSLFNFQGPLSQITKMNSFRCEKQRFLKSLSWLANIKIILRINTKVKLFFQKIQKVFKSQVLGAFSTVYHNILLVILHINAIKSHKSTLLFWMWSVDVDYSVEIATAQMSLAMTFSLCWNCHGSDEPRNDVFLVLRLSRL